MDISAIQQLFILFLITAVSPQDNWWESLDTTPITTPTPKTKPNFTLGVFIMMNLFGEQIDDYKSILQCISANHRLDSEYDIVFELAYRAEIELSPEAVLRSICDKYVNQSVSSVALIVPDAESKLPIYKYIVNSISALKIPLIVWNDHIMTENIFSNVIHLAPVLKQQAEAHVTLLKYYNWNEFSILTTTTPGHKEYTSAIRRLVRMDSVVQSSNSKKPFEVRSSHLITKMEDEEIEKKLNDLNDSDTRVILLHMTNVEVIQVMKIAEKLKMTGNEFMWIGTSAIYLGGHLQPEQLPLGMIALKPPVPNEEEEEEFSKLSSPIYMAADFWRESIDRYVKRQRNFTIPPLFNCGNKLEAWENGTELYSQMIDQKYKKRTPKGCADKVKKTFSMEFDHGGANRLVSYEFVNLGFEKADSSDAASHKKQKKWIKIGSWYSPNVTELDDITWPGDSPKPPEGTPARSFLTIVTKEEVPYIKYSDPNLTTGKCETIKSVPVQIKEHFDDVSCPECEKKRGLNFKCATGLCIDLLEKLKDDLMFEYRLVNARDDQWGNDISENGQKAWNGIVRDLIDGYADMSMATLNIVPQRSKVIDFSVPFIETGITIIVYIKKGVISHTAFLEPYDVVSWVAVLVVGVHVMGSLILLFDYASPAHRHRYKHWTGNRFSLARSLWLIWTILFGAAVETDNTKGIASRFLAAIWSLFSLVFLASYTANLAAFMITKEEYFNLSGMNDTKLVNPTNVKPPFRFATVPDGSTALNIKKNHPEMFEYMKRFNKESVTKGIEAVKNNEVQAFIYDASKLDYEASRDEDCRLTTVGDWYAMTGYGLGFPKGSKWRDRFDIFLSKYIHEGEMDRLRKFWLTGACKKPSTGKGRESSHSLDIINFTSAYILLIVGIVLAVLLLLAEHAYFKFCRRKLRKIDECGCCSLISLSMGESLSFEESVMEVIDNTMKRCTNELCKNNQSRLSYDLDLAVRRLNMLQATLQGKMPIDALPPKDRITDQKDDHTNQVIENPTHQTIIDQPENIELGQLALTTSNSTYDIPPKNNLDTREKKVWSKGIKFREESSKDENQPLKREHIEKVETCL